MSETTEYIVLMETVIQDDDDSDSFYYSAFTDSVESAKEMALEDCEPEYQVYAVYIKVE
jgi:hypothetical protein